MKKSIKTQDIVAGYKILATAKLTKCDEATKFLIIRNTRILKSNAQNFLDLLHDAQEAYKGKDHDKMINIIKQWQAESEKCQLPESTKLEAFQYMQDYRAKIANCVINNCEATCEIECKTMTSAQFKTLVASNEEWEVEKIMLLEDILC